MSKLLSVVAILLIAFCSNAYGQIWYPRLCRTISIMPNFQPQRFVGTWYEQSRYDYTRPWGGDCNHVSITTIDNTNNEFFTVNNTMRLTNETEINRVGYARFFQDRWMPIRTTRFDIVSNATVPHLHSEFHVLFTDYETYAILYNCQIAHNSTEHQPGSEEFAWIMTREQQPPAQLKYLISRLSSIFLEPHRLRVTEQDSEHCGAPQLFGGFLLALIVSILHLVK